MLDYLQLGSIVGSCILNLLCRAMDLHFLPTDLTSKLRYLVVAYHKQHGNVDLLYNKEAFVVSAAFPDMLSLGLAAHAIFKMRCVLWVLGVVVLIASAALTWWLAWILPVLILFDRHLARKAYGHVVLIRTMMVALEALSRDFVGWGQRYPDARIQAKEAVALVGSHASLDFLEKYFTYYKSLAHDSVCVSLFTAPT